MMNYAIIDCYEGNQILVGKCYTLDQAKRMAANYMANDCDGECECVLYERIGNTREFRPIEVL